MKNKSDAYRAITKLLEKGCAELALKKIEEGRNSLRPPEHLECLGNYFFYTRHQQNAVNRFEEAMTQYPDYHCARYHYLLGVKAEVGKDLEEAFRRYNAAIEVEPTFVDSYIELAGLFVKANDYEAAAKTYERALEFDPKDLRIYFNLVEVYRALMAHNKAFQQRFERAKEIYELMATQLGPLPKCHHW
jgi:tetratricopeptide (TPR) repeat protein